MATKVFYLDLDKVLAIHTDQIERYGGSHGLRDTGLLESAIFRPQSSFAGNDLYVSIFEKAAALFHSILKNHPFVDGNKRTATASTLIFLEMNGLTLNVKQDDLVKFVLKMEKSGDLAQIAKWLEAWTISV